MKTFYTERDIEDMHAAGKTELEVDDDVVLTDLAREKALALGLRLTPASEKKKQAERMLRAFGVHLSPAPKSAVQPTVSAPSPAASPKMDTGSTEAELVQHVKAAVIAKLGSNEYNGLLDQIIPRVLARLANGPTASSHLEPPAAKTDKY